MSLTFYPVSCKTKRIIQKAKTLNIRTLTFSSRDELPKLEESKFRGKLAVPPARAPLLFNAPPRNAALAATLPD